MKISEKRKKELIHASALAEINKRVDPTEIFETPQEFEAFEKLRLWREILAERMRIIDEKDNKRARELVGDDERLFYGFHDYLASHRGLEPRSVQDLQDWLDKIEDDWRK